MQNKDLKFEIRHHWEVVRVLSDKTEVCCWSFKTKEEAEEKLKKLSQEEVNEEEKISSRLIP